MKFTYVYKKNTINNTTKNPSITSLMYAYNTYKMLIVQGFFYRITLVDFRLKVISIKYLIPEIGVTYRHRFSQNVASLNRVPNLR